MARANQLDCYSGHLFQSWRVVPSIDRWQQAGAERRFPVRRCNGSDKPADLTKARNR